MENMNSGKKIVVKFGGSSLADHERLSKAVASVVNEAKKGTRIAVVVSAMGKTTDLLLSTAKNTSNGKLEKQELGEILRMGERTAGSPAARASWQKQKKKKSQRSEGAEATPPPSSSPRLSAPTRSSW